jgi:hypothetical protein
LRNDTDVDVSFLRNYIMKIRSLFPGLTSGATFVNPCGIFWIRFLYNI